MENKEYRFLSDTELKYNITKKEIDNESVSLNELISKLSKKNKELVLSAIELYKREKEGKIERITNSKDIVSIMYPLLCDLDHEEIWAIYLSHNLRVLDKIQHSKGGIVEASFDQRLILKRALEINATRIILVHNHPSGNSLPSIPDNNITNKLKECCKLFNISLLDHVIITPNNEVFYSYSDNRKL
jgi:DNA repair protein RadC